MKYGHAPTTMQGPRSLSHNPWNPKGYLGNVIHRVPISMVA